MLLPDWVLSVVWGTVLGVVVFLWLCVIALWVSAAYFGLRWLLRRLRRRA